jgi:16S rRNA (guanine527-N7)-methyltransferase
VNLPVPAVPPVAAELFGARLELAERYAELLATDGLQHGLLGPRERDRLWDRHLVNCALVAELLPRDARVVDVGSGAGLPGLVLALCRPDLQVDLVESMQRRVDFLERCVTALGLVDAVRVVRGRIEDTVVATSVGDAQWVTARAVAPLDRLAGWCLPLLAQGGTLLALKGARAADEAAEHASAIRRLGGIVADVVHCGVGRVDQPATVIVVHKR